MASEASALANYLTSGEARPTTRPPRLSTRGVDRRPTLVDNVETLAHLALIARRGPDWFRAVGTPDQPGTALVTVGGAVHRPGVHEVASGTSLGALLALAGGPSASPQAVLLGGWGGVWRTRSAPTPGGSEVDPGAEGLGLVTVLPDHACGLAETANILHHLARASAGQCGPCMFGLPTVAQEFERLVVGPTTRLDQDRLGRHLADVVRARGVLPPRRGSASGPERAGGLRRRPTGPSGGPSVSGRLLPTRPVRARARERGASMTPPKRLSVDPIACTGHGVCADMLPELIELDDWGYPRIDPGAVPGQPPAIRSPRRDRMPGAGPAVEVGGAVALQEISQTPRRSSSGNTDPAERRS